MDDSDGIDDLLRLAARSLTGHRRRLFQAEVARALRFINVAFGIWLVAAPFLLTGTGRLGAIVSVVVGIALIGLSLPRGKRSAEHYASWDKYVI